MAHKQILIVTSLVLALATAHESCGQNCGCGVGDGPPIYGGPGSHSQSYYDLCAPTSRGCGVSASRRWRGRHRHATVTYGCTPQVYAVAPAYRRFDPVPQAQSAAKPGVKSVAKVPLPAPPTDPKIPPAPLTPPELQDMIATSQKQGNLTTLLELADFAQLLDEARAGGPFTVLAPDNQAFARLPAEQLEQLKSDQDLLRQVVLHHVISDAKLAAAELATRQTYQPLSGPELRITTEAGEVRVDDARILQEDIECDRAFIHVIDRVLIPPDVLSAIEEAQTQPAPGTGN
ncbi:MAG: fasciclin domain-containing protein [Pirellulaceae bacterium]